MTSWQADAQALIDQAARAGLSRSLKNALSDRIRAKPENGDAVAAEILESLLPGCEVVLVGLSGSKELNGCTGVCLGTRQGERFPVFIHCQLHQPAADWNGGSWRKTQPSKPLAVRLRNVQLCGQPTVAPVARFDRIDRPRMDDVLHMP